MNADGSRGVDTEIITAGMLTYLGLRTPRPPKAPSVTLQPAHGPSPSGSGA